ncbi:hypothetical protein [Neobacillus sp. D3-1R]|uniref:hypothetical protein n=1 Tax=Neobacillus sp. D3-1R TaxID=3445778 RepID=UPI003FA07C46
MSVGMMILIYAFVMFLFWLGFSYMYKVLYNERKIICYSCKKKVRDSGGRRCSKCGGMLYED